MKRFKMQVQEDDAHPELWHDVLDERGAPLLFDDESKARTELEARYPILVKLERFAAGPKRTRVIVAAPYADVDEERER
ncbi:MAG: hypothetical protein HY255_12715 [Betaproteobacteria bacterium]|nr:hypothetical protein [Betaproteobacteria bacterium]